MPTRQYIGARYVPEFFYGVGGSAEWVANTQYEALTIVTRNGNSYTSRKPVPTSVGAPESNPEYWASTGIFNSQVEQYREEVAELAETVSGIQEDVEEITPKPFKGIFISDSFGNAILSNLKSYTGTTDSDWYVSNVNGTGFAKGDENTTYIARLNALDVSDPDAVTHVIAIGGTNDTSSSYSSGIGTAVQNFVLRAKELFPNAKVLIGYCATLYRSTDWSGFNRSFMSYFKFRYQQGTLCNGGIFIDGLTECLTDMVRRVDTDHVHPSGEGYFALAAIIASYLKDGGNVTIPSPLYFNTGTWTFTQNSVTYNVQYRYHGGDVVPELVIRQGVLYNGNAISIAAGTALNVIDYDHLPMIPYNYGSMLRTADVLITASGTAHIYTAVITISTSGLSITLHGSSGAPTSGITRIEILGDVSFNFKM